MELQYKEAGMRVNLPYGMLNVSSDEDFGFNPSDLMVASIAGNSTSVFMKVLEEQRVKVDDISVRTEITRNSEEADRIEKISIYYVIKGKNLSDDKLYKNLAIARKKCSMIRSVESSIEIKESIESIELSV